MPTEPKRGAERETGAAELDHLVYAVPDLAAAAARFASQTGVAPRAGGRHVGLGTRNMLVGLGGRRYLEIIGPDPDDPPAPGAVMPFGLGRLTAPRVVTWAVRPADFERAVRAAAAAGADLGDVHRMSRTLPDGTELSWRLAVPLPMPFDGVVPFVIDWGSGPHPTDDPSLPAVELLALSATHPAAADVLTILAALGAELPVVDGPARMVAVLGTPRGRLTLT